MLYVSQSISRARTFEIERMQDSWMAMADGESEMQQLNSQVSPYHLVETL
jgi:hypothetical protein